MGLETYRGKRHPDRTPEPVPDVADRPGDHTGEGRAGRGDRFVIQEHHATALHAKQTEDHPMGYPTFEGAIPPGEYGGGRVSGWDAGSYELENWTDTEVKVVLHGARAAGRYVFFRTSGQNWMVHRMGSRPTGWEPVPRDLRPMLAVAGALPVDDENWSYEVKWDGVRALVAAEAGRITLTSRNGNDVTSHYPELGGLGLQLGSRSALFDAEIVAVSSAGRSDFGLLQARMHVAKPGAALLRSTPVQLMLFDLLHLEGGSLLHQSYDERRQVLDGLGLQGEHWSVPPAFVGGGQALLDATREQGLEGILAKRRSGRYLPGKRSDSWLKVKHIRRTSTVIAGWKPGEGGRAGRIGSLLLGVQGPNGLEYAGHVGTGFSAATLTRLGELLEPTRIAESPFATPVPRLYAKGAIWVQPRLVAEVDYTEWTKDGRLRHPSYKGLREDYDPKDVVRE